MRPSDGYWCTRRGYNVHYAAQMCEIDVTDDSITVYAACHAICSRGDTLGGPMLTIRFTSPLENCVKVTIDHYEGALHPGPFFELSEDSGFRPTVQKRPDGCWELLSGKTSVRIGAEGESWNISYWYDGILLTKSEGRTASYITLDPFRQHQAVEETESRPFYDRSDRSCGSYIREMLNVSVGENLPGGSWYERKYDYFGLPLYARPNSILAYGNFERSADYDYADGMKLVLYGMEEGKEASCKVYSPDGALAADVTARREKDAIYLSVTGTDKPFTAESAQGFPIVLL